MNYYSIYGIQVEVSGTQDRLDACPGAPPASLSLHLDGLPEWVESSPRELWFQAPATTVRPQPPTIFRLTHQPFYLFRYWDGCQFLIHREGCAIWAAWPSTIDLAQVVPYIFGPVLGSALRFLGVSTLHASVVEINGLAVVITGQSGVGKSTTAAAFAKLGYRVLSDDLAPLRHNGGAITVAPGYPRVCLWPPSVRLLFGSEDALPLIMPGWKKHYLSLTSNGYRFSPDPLPLGGIYWISERLDSPEAPRIEELPPSTALIGLVANTYAGRFPNPSMAAQDIRLYAEIVRSLPVRKLAASADPSLILEQCQKLALDFMREQK